MDEIARLQELKFVKDMGALSLLTFGHVYSNNDEFVQFTRESMSEGKGIFKDWIRYVKLRDKIKQNDGTRTEPDSKQICVE